MLYRAKRRAVTADDIQDLMMVRGVPGRPGSYLVSHRKRLAIITKISSKYRYPWVGVSESASGIAPLVFGPVADFSPVGDIEGSELDAVIRAVPESRWQGSLFESPDLMVRTEWFRAVPESRWQGRLTTPRSRRGGDGGS